MIIKASTCVILQFYSIVNQMHVILQNPSRYKTGSKDQISTSSAATTAAIDQ